MKFNGNTIFPLTLILIGVLIVLSPGDEPLSRRVPFVLGWLHFPIGFGIAGTGMWLYARSKRVP